MLNVYIWQTQMSQAVFIFGADLEGRQVKSSYQSFITEFHESESRLRLIPVVPMGRETTFPDMQ